MTNDFYDYISGKYKKEMQFQGEFIAKEDLLNLYKPKIGDENKITFMNVVDKNNYEHYKGGKMIKSVAKCSGCEFFVIHPDGFLSQDDLARVKEHIEYWGHSIEVSHEFEFEEKIVHVEQPSPASLPEEE